MISAGIGLLLLSLITGDALVLCGGDLAHIDLGTGTVTPSVGMLNTYPNDIVIHDGFAFVVNSGSDEGTLQRFEIGSWDLVELGIGTGWNCWASLPLSSGELAVTAALDNSVSMVSPSSMTVTSTIGGVGPNPEWMAEHDGTLYVACGGWGAGNSVVAVDLSTGTVTDTLTAGTNCQSLAVSDDGKLFVLCSGTYGSNEGSVAVIDPANGAILADLPLGGFPGFCTAVNGTFYASDPWGAGVFSVDMATMTVLHDSSNPFCSGGNGLAADDAGNLWVTDAMTGEVRVYDSSENLIHTYSLAGAGQIAVSGSYTGIFGGVSPAAGIFVSPSPAVSWISVTGAAPGSRITVFDISGRVASEAVASAAGEAEMSVDHLSSGVYTVVNGYSTRRFAVTGR